MLVVLCVCVGYALAIHDRASATYLYLDQTDEAQRLDPTQSKFAKTRGDAFLRQNIPPKLNLATAEYLKAVSLAPNDVVHWRDWSEIMQRRGQIDMAIKAMKMAEYLAPNDHVVQMELGNCLMGEGRLDDAAQYHHHAIELNPSLATTLYPVYWSMGWTTTKTVQSLLTSNSKLLCKYWAHALDWLEPKGAGELWDTIRQTHGDVFDTNSYKRYFDFLIAAREYGQAQDLWDVIVDKFYAISSVENSEKDNLLWNGNFQYRDSLLNGGLEWRISKSLPHDTRALVSFSKGLERNNCLWVHFSGKENVSFSHVRRSFFVEPATTYTLKYHVSSLNITTDNTPYVRVTVFADKPVITKGQVVGSVGAWDCEETFFVPDGAYWAEIAICRDRSNKLSNRIMGDVWFDDFTLLKKVPAAVVEDSNQ